MRFPLILSTLLLGVVLGCSGGSRPAAPSGTLTVRLGSDSLPGYGQVVVSVDKLEGNLDGIGWVTVGAVNATYDLQTLQNGGSVVLVAGARVGAGSYSQFRLTWAASNYKDNTKLPAYVMPVSGAGLAMQMPTSTVVAGPVVVPANGSASAQLMLSGQQAVQVHAGAAAPAQFQATGSAYDATAIARITGHLADGSLPLAGVEVFAETVDGNLLASIQRRALSDAAGNYVLEALPAGAVYYVAAQPAGVTSAYGALTSAPVNAAAPVSYGADLAFSSPASPGSLNVVITPASAIGVGTWVELRQILLTGPGVGQNLIVRSGIAATGASQDSVSFQGLAAGSYGLKVQRSTAGGPPVAKVGGSPMVTAGASTAVTISLP
jgi:hypothetical protein